MCDEKIIGYMNDCRFMMKRTIAIVLTLLLYSCVALHSQVLSDTIREVKVIGKKASEAASAVPLHSVSNEDLQRLGVNDIADAIHRLPGITLKDYGGAGGMKTVSVRGFGAQHTGVSYDGIMLSDCNTGEIDIQRYAVGNMQSVSLNIGDRDDVFTTARSVTTPATINLETSTRQGIGAMITAGSWGLMNPSLNFGAYINKVSLGGNLDFMHADNNYPFTLYNVTTETREHRTHSKMNQGHGELNASWQINPSSTLSAKIYYYDNDRELPGVVHYYTDENDESLRERNIFAQARLKTVLSTSFSLMVNGKWNWASSNYHNGMPSGGVTSADYWQREYYGSAALLYAPTQSFAVDYSIDYYLNNLNSSLTVMPNAERKSLLQSLTAKYSTRRLTLMGRMLWSNYMGEAHRLSPSASISYRLLDDEQLYLRASFKSIFRMPTFRELYYFHLGDANLRPEKTSQYNLGITWSGGVNRRLNLTATLDAYYNTITDKIVSIPINMFVWRNINMAKAHAYGLDLMLDAKYQIAKRHQLSLYTNYSLQNVRNMTDSSSPYYKNQIAYTPQHSGSAALGWQNPWVSLTLSADAMGERWTTNEHSQGTRLAGFVEFSATAYRTFAIRKSELTLQASVLNILDKQYEIVARYPMPGRSCRFTVAFKY